MKPSISGYVVRCSKDTYRDTCSKDVAVMRNKTMAEALRSSGDDMGAGMVSRWRGGGGLCRLQSSKNESQRTQEGESKMRQEEGGAQQATGRNPT